MSHLAYVTVFWKEDQLSGVVVLASSLRKHGANFPLVVLVTEDIPPGPMLLLETLASNLQIIVERVVQSPLDDDTPEQPKLALYHVFSPVLWTYETVCYLAPFTVVVREGLDLVFADAHLPADNWIGAPFLCTCDPRATARSEVQAGTCPYKTLVPRRKSFGWVPPNASREKEEEDQIRGKPMDVRMMVFSPGERLWESVLAAVTLHNGGTVLSPPPVSPEQFRAWKVLDGAVGHGWIALPPQYSGGEFQCGHRPAVTEYNNMPTLPITGIYSTANIGTRSPVNDEWARHCDLLG
jgi:hypothetical protein